MTKMYCVQEFDKRLTRGRIYDITDKHIKGYVGYYRIKRDDTGTPRLFSEEMFSSIDPLDCARSCNEKND